MTTHVSLPLNTNQPIHMDHTYVVWKSGHEHIISFDFWVCSFDRFAPSAVVCYISARGLCMTSMLQCVSYSLTLRVILWKRYCFSLFEVNFQLWPQDVTLLSISLDLALIYTYSLAPVWLANVRSQGLQYWAKVMLQCHYYRITCHMSSLVMVYNIARCNA